jgi:uncharacterized membrane protein
MPDVIRTGKKHSNPSNGEYARTIPCNKISVSDVFHWLSLAHSDFVRTPVISLFYGVCFAICAALIALAVYLQGSHLVILPSLVIFMLIGPFLATGMYDISWELEKGHKPTLKHSMRSITRNSTAEWGFAILLAVIMIAWSRIAALLHALYPSTTGASFEEFLPFLTIGTTFGVILTAVVFSISVFSLPVLMERKVDLMTAIFTSWNAVRENTGPMLVWAFIIFFGVLIGFATGGIALVYIMPILGYATWHGYINTVMTKRERNYE